MAVKNIVIFASGSGSNAEKIIQFFTGHPLARVIALFSNNPDSGAIEKANKAGVYTFAINKDSFKNPLDLIDQLKMLKTDYIILAGFLWLLPVELVVAYPGRIINIHPALLPGYGGKGMYGHHVHEAVILNKEKFSGITIHLVNEMYDEGEILCQEKCEISENDSALTLSRKVQQLEHLHFPIVIEKYIKEHV